MNIIKNIISTIFLSQSLVGLVHSDGAGALTSFLGGVNAPFTVVSPGARNLTDLQIDLFVQGDDCTGRLDFGYFFSGGVSYPILSGTSTVFIDVRASGNFGSSLCAGSTVLHAFNIASMSCSGIVATINDGCYIPICSAGGSVTGYSVLNPQTITCS